MLKISTRKSAANFLILIVVFSLGLGIGVKSLNKQTAQVSQTAEKNTPKAFISEIYDKIKDNYWNNISDAELLDLFKISIEKNGGTTKAFKFADKNKLLEGIAQATSGMNNEQKNKFLAAVASAVLSSLQPADRSGLYTQKQEETLKNIVENRNPETGKVEPTIFTKVLDGEVLYLQFQKFSPTTLEEFQKAFESYKDNSVNKLILDLRGNSGGAIDSTAYFLGFFLGKNQYAFDFYKKGEYLPFKTPTDKLASLLKYKQMVVLIDQNTQSSGEMLAASLKKYHLGVLVGDRTKGWGTVERVFPLDNQISQKEKYSIFLVHSITLRDDNLPIEGRGVDPDINLKDTNWPDKLLQYFNNPALVNEVKEIL